MSTDNLARRTIARVERLPSSINGNPRFCFYFTDGSSGALCPDAAFGYEATNAEYRPGKEVDVKFAPEGGVEYMRPAVGGPIMAAVFDVMRDRGQLSPEEIEDGAAEYDSLYEEFIAPAIDAAEHRIENLSAGEDA